MKGLGVANIYIVCVCGGGVNLTKCGGGGWLHFLGEGSKENQMEGGCEEFFWKGGGVNWGGGKFEKMLMGWSYFLGGSKRRPSWGGVLQRFFLGGGGGRVGVNLKKCGWGGGHNILGGSKEDQMGENFLETRGGI